MKIKDEFFAFIDRQALRILPKNPRWRGITIMILGAALATVALVGPFGSAGVLAGAMEYLTFPMIVAEIEQFRSDLAESPCGAQSMAYHTTRVSYNLRIAHEHESNRQWYSDPFSPDVPETLREWGMTYWITYWVPFMSDWKIPLIGGHNWFDVGLLELPEC